MAASDDDSKHSQKQRRTHAIALEREETEQKEDVREEKKKSPSENISERISASTPARVSIFVLTFVLFLAAWQVVADLTNSSIILSGPLPVFQALFNLLQNNLPRATAGLQSPVDAISQTLEIIFLGFGLASLVGIPIGVLEGRWTFAEDIVDPWVEAAHAIPVVALIPALYFAIGGGFVSYVFVAFLLAVFSIIVNTQNGVKYSIGSLSDVGRSFRASEPQFIEKIVLPASLPDIVTGLRVGLGRAILGAVLAQALLSGNGLGGMLVAFQDLYATPYTMATIVIIAALGIVLLQLPKLFQRRAYSWRNLVSDRIRGVPKIDI